MIVAKITPHYKKERKTNNISFISGQVRLYIGNMRQHNAILTAPVDESEPVVNSPFLPNKNAGIMCEPGPQYSTLQNITLPPFLE
jgi:hypothetical protein